jgi:hypothetical protein
LEIFPLATCTYLGTQIPNLRGLSIDGLHAGIAMHAAGLLPRDLASRLQSNLALTVFRSQKKKTWGWGKRWLRSALLFGEAHKRN